MNRRDLVKSLAASAAVAPFASLKADTQKKVKAKKKLAIITTGLGFYDSFFKPKTDDLNSSPLLKVLNKHHNDITLFRNIAQPEIGHGHKNGAGLLSCNIKQSNGAMMSLDQVAAESVTQDARFKTLHLGGRSLVWNKNSREVHSEMEIGPEKIYKKLFTKFYADIELQKKVETLKVFQTQMSTKANPFYKAAVKELEEEIRIDLEWNKKSIPKVEIDSNLHLADAHGRGYITPVEQHLQLIRLGLQHERAQIVVGGTPYVDKTSTIGIEGSYHSVGHKTTSGEAGQKEQLWKIEDYLFTSFDKFLTSMKEAKILDDTIVLVVGGFNDAGKHQRSSVPTMIIGGGFKHQGVVECLNNQNLEIKLSHLYLTILHQMGIDAGDFGGDSKNLDKLLV